MKRRLHLMLVLAAVVAALWATPHVALRAAEDPKPDDPVTEPEAPEQTEFVEPLEPPEDVVKTFKAAEVKSHIRFLAGKKCEGRASGFPGCDIAGSYIRDLCVEWGLEPAGEDGGYLQPFQVRLVPFPGTPVPKGEVGEGTTFNVCALLRGSDETLKDEYVVLSAHYDHVGRKSKKKVFWGADDNASGTSALLQVARAYAEEGAPRPRRSILFLWFSAEERGLLGSKYYVGKPTVPLPAIVCDLNIDMVGRNEKNELHVYGNASSPDLDSAHQIATETSGFTFLAKTGSIFLRSDQVNFYERDIPCLFWTSGLHSDYHATTDTAGKIVTSKVANAAQHAYLTSWIIANRTERPAFTKMDENASSGPLGAVLDSIPASELPERVKVGENEGAVLVRTVMDGGPGAEAKLKPGDFIVEVDGRVLPNGDPVSAVETALVEAGKRVKLTVVRGSRRMRISVKL